MARTIERLREFRLSSPGILDGREVEVIAKRLLGYFIITEFNGLLSVGKIVETEAYRAPEDKASHAYNFRRTARTAIAYASAGKAYVYLCYGIHHLFNIVTGPAEVPHVVLIRGLEPILGIPHMMRRRGHDRLKPQLSAGPGVLTKALGINKAHNGVDMLDPGSSIWLSEAEKQDFEIVASPRVGIDYAEEWIDIPWRFRIKDNPYCSPAK